MNSVKTTLQQKQELRQKMLRKRAAVPTAQKQRWDAALCEHLQACLKPRAPRTVHCYLPFPDEVQYYAVIEWMLGAGIQVVCPCTLPQGVLEHRVLQSLQELKSGAFNTRHPAAQKIYTGCYDAIIVPGLAFTKEGYRIGYGGGYYDRFLAQAHCKYTVALAYPFQRVDALPREAHDKPVAEILYP